MMFRQGSNGSARFSQIPKEAQTAGISSGYGQYAVFFEMPMIDGHEETCPSLTIFVHVDTFVSPFVSSLEKKLA